MDDTIIKVEKLSKRYRIGAREEGYKTFREAIIDGFTAPIRNFKKLRKLTTFDSNKQGQSDMSDVIWALKDVSFDVREGEVVGIIGRNGAGKTTLLKILSRITEPTEGDIKLRGRVASLLEVGTGFHAELTGRENIYLNGSILGMRKVEIDSKFDEIVEFAETGKFLDTPVKRYSSGMYVRLAFAVAAHLDPEILIVDEVLAVGDLEFQRKCLGKMRDVATGGRTILFVSHNMGAIRQLCERTILLNQGEIIEDGPSAEVVGAYEKKSFGILNNEENAIVVRNPKDVLGKEAWISRIEIRDSDGKLSTYFAYGDKMELTFKIGGKPPQNNFTLEWIIYNEKGEYVTYGGSYAIQGFTYMKEQTVASCTLGPLCLTIGTFQIAAAIRIWPNVHWDWWAEAARFQIVECDPQNTSFAIHGNNFGYVHINQKWR